MENLSTGPDTTNGGYPTDVGSHDDSVWKKVPESGHREAGRGSVRAFESGLHSLDHRNRTEQKMGAGRLAQL